MRVPHFSVLPRIAHGYLGQVSQSPTVGESNGDLRSVERRGRETLAEPKAERRGRETLAEPKVERRSRETLAEPKVERRGRGDPRRTKGRTAGSGDPRRTKQVRNESSRDQMAAKTNFAACQREGPPKIPHPSTGALWTMTGGPACRWIGQCRRWNMPCRDGPTPMRQCRRT